MKKLILVLTLLFTTSCSTPNKKIAKDFDGLILTNEFDGSQYRVQYIPNQGYALIKGIEVTTTDTSYIVFKTLN